MMASIKTYEICWTPGTDKMVLLPQGDEDIAEYEMHDFASNDLVQTYCEELAISFCQAFVMQLILRDNMKPALVHKVMSELSEYQRGSLVSTRRFCQLLG